MGIAERRAREREKRRAEILDAAWIVAEKVGWATFSVERVAAEAELGRATVYGYFESLDDLVIAMAEAALDDLSNRVADSKSLAESLDVPLRLSQKSPAAFALLFQQSAVDVRPTFSNERLGNLRAEARRLIGALQRLAHRSREALPADAAEAQAFLTGIAMAGATVPALMTNTPLRRRWQDFVLGEAIGGAADPKAPGEATPTGVRRVRPR
jgi:AcrR family transcriptional regulator